MPKQFAVEIVKGEEQKTTTTTMKVGQVVNELHKLKVGDAITVNRIDDSMSDPGYINRL